jgi:TetR/AcrR family transcriptional regulator, transcriptional repressor for nem operon
MTSTSPSPDPRRLRGRPREFDMDEALDKAIQLFRARGFHPTSIADLTSAMALASGSLYKAFKDKRAVFLAAFDRYTALRAEQVRQVAEGGGSGRDRLRAVLAFYAASAQGSEGRRGCLVVGSAVEMAVFDPEIAARVTATLAKNQALIAGLIRQGEADGSIRAGIDADNTAQLMVCLTQGMRVIGKAGWPLPDPESVVDLALKLLD